MSIIYKMNSSGTSIYRWDNPTSYKVIRGDN